MTNRNEWTPDMIRRFSELHTSPESFSFSQLSAMMSASFGVEITRNACIGKARRLGLPERSGKVRTVPPREGRKVKIRPRVDAPIVPEPEPPRTGGGVSIYQLGSCVCKWPLGVMEDRPPYVYCGGAAPIGDPYCSEHAAKSRGSHAPRS